jgi:glycosyltransferase involved in cell wall biosynthesis
MDVDGHSTDDTIAVAKQLLPTIRIIKQVGKGKGNALKAGFGACTGDIIVMLDADGSTNPIQMRYPVLLKCFADCVIPV